MIGCSFDIERRWNLPLIAGVDEAGRGCLAGPVVAAAVIFDSRLRTFEALEKNSWLQEIRDSKVVKPEARERLFDIISREALAFGVGRVEADEIDQINILQATFKAARLAIQELTKKVSPDLVLMDGNHPIAELQIRQQPVISGDKLSKTIAAASILAKVTRDRWMVEQQQKFPEYGFSAHKGYGTEIHREALKIHGPCELHRRTFLKEKAKLNLGRKGEAEALDYLTRSQLSILKKNWKTQIGEVDIIAEADGIVHFVEVRSRSHFHELAQVFPEQKQMKLTQLARAFMARHPEFQDSRVQVDLLLVEKGEVEPFWNVLEL